MPAFPSTSARIAALPGGVYSKFASRIAALKGEIYPLQVGDTWMAPVESAQMAAFTEAKHPGMHRYTPPRGLPALVDFLAEKRGVSPGQIMIAASGTAGLEVLANTLLDVGDEVMILAPYWPLVGGIVRINGATPVEVPFLDGGADGDVRERLEALRTERTVAIYLNTPNNPTGRVYSRETVEAIAAFARQHGLWIWSDEVYEDYVYSGEHVSMAAVAPERTFTIYSFSKAYGLAGCRCGYLVGPTEAVVGEVLKAGTHTYYSAPTPSQLSALAALKEGGAWLAHAKQQYQAIGERVADILGVARPQGGTFLFLDARPLLDEGGLDGFLEDCLAQNLILAPGTSFGPENYSDFVRLCFTCAPPDVVERGAVKLAALVAARRR